MIFLVSFVLESKHWKIPVLILFVIQSALSSTQINEYILARDLE